MKTIEEVANEICAYVDNSCEAKTVAYESFVGGVEFAQHWIPIERHSNGYIKSKQLLEIEKNLPVIINDEDGIENEEYIIIRYISDLLDMDKSFTHWRPVNLK